MTTPLPDVDRADVAGFWQRAIAAGVAPAGSPIPDQVEPFGDSVELADELLALVIDGPKRATACSYDELIKEALPIPAIGVISIATDGAGRARAVLRTTDVRVGPLSSVDDEFAWDEGEGDRTRAGWLREHERFFRRWLPQIGLTFDPDMATLFERFELLYAE